jgi:hypothetical protein
MAVAIHPLDAYRTALSANAPLSALRSVVADALRENGGNYARVTRDLEQLRLVLRDEGRDDDEDTVLEVLSYLVGWSGPKLRL